MRCLTLFFTIMTNELIEQIESFADEWLAKTGKETLFDSLQGFDFASDCYASLSDELKLQISEGQFLGALEASINLKF